MKTTDKTDKKEGAYVMEVLMGIFVKACVAVAVGVNLPGWSESFYSKRKIGKMHSTQEPADLMTQTQQESQNAAASHMTCRANAVNVTNSHWQHRKKEFVTEIRQKR